MYPRTHCFYDLSDMDTTLKSIILTDISGKTTRTFSDPDISGELSLKHLATGIYIVSFETSNTSRLSKKIQLK